MISAGGVRQFEFIYEAAGNPRNEAADHSAGAAGERAAGVLRPDPLGRHQPDGAVLVRRRHVDDRRSPGAAEHVHQPGHRAGRAERSGAPSSRWPTSTGSGSIRTPAVAPAAVAVAVRPSPTSSTAPTSAAAVGGHPPRSDADRLRRRAAHPGGPGRRLPDAPTRPRTSSSAPMPTGAWTATTKVAFKGTAQYHQAGIILRGDDDNLVKFGRIAAGSAGEEKFEFIQEINAVARNDAADSTANLPGELPERLLPADESPTGPTSPARTRPTARRGPRSGVRRRSRRTRRSVCSPSTTRRRPRRWRTSTGSSSRVRPVRPARRVTTTSPATRWTRRAGTRSCATTRPSTRSAAAT